MLLTIAAGNSRLSLGEPSSTFTRSSSGMKGFASATRHATSSTSEQAKSLFFEGGGRPVSIDRGSYGCKSNPSCNLLFTVFDTRSITAAQKSNLAVDNKIIFSGRHEGLAFYFARLIRSIWKQKITKISYVSMSYRPVRRADDIRSRIDQHSRTNRVKYQTFRTSYCRLFSVIYLLYEPSSSSTSSPWPDLDLITSY